MPGAERTLTVPAALDAAGVASLAHGVQQAGPGDVLVLRAAATGVFCRGLAATTLSVPPAPSVRDGLARFADLLLSLATEGRPSLAVVDGAALGGGVALACACDVVIATPEARFGLPETSAGLPPHLVLAVLARRTTIATRQRLALDGRAIDAAEAHRLGLVDAVVEPDALDRTITGTVRQLARVPASAAARVKAHPADATALREVLAVAVEATWHGLQDATVVQALVEQLGAA